MAEENKTGGLKIPGFELFLPTTISGTVSLSIIAFCIAATVIAVSFIASKTPPETLRQVGNMVTGGGVKAIRYEGNRLSSLRTMRQFQFMTPSADSWKKASERYGSTEQVESLKKKFGWMNVNDAKVDQFGEQLIQKKFTQGWRRYPYEGQGHFRDVGWWWVITVDPDFPVDDFIKFYLSYWQTDEIYLEEFETFGEVLPTRGIPTPQLPNR